MEEKEFFKIGEKLVKKHAPKWSLVINSNKSRLGNCNYKTTTVGVSKYLLKSASDKEIINTILHEIAHILIPYENHGKDWKAKLIELGGNGQRCASENLSLKFKDAILPKYTYICNSCKGEVYANRCWTRKKACSDCCDNYNKNKYSEKYLLELKK